MVNLSARTYRPERQTIDFLVSLERITGKLDTCIAQHTRVVSVVVAAMLGARTTLNLHLRLIIMCLATDNHTTPVARSALSCSLCRGEDNRSISRALRDKLAATLHDESSLSGFVALDDGARLDGKLRASTYIYPSLESVDTLLESLLAFEYEFLVAVADYLALSIVLAILSKEQVVASLQTTVSGPCVGCVLTRSRVVVITAAAHCGSHHQDAHASEKIRLVHNVFKILIRTYILSVILCCVPAYSSARLPLSPCLCRRNTSL